MSTRIANQINQSADSYLPSVYQALTQYSDFERSNDAMAAEFIPLSQARVSRETKLMVFGVLPPTANVSGKLLDRSANAVEFPPYTELSGQIGAATQASAVGVTKAKQSKGWLKMHRDAYTSCKAAMERLFKTTPSESEVRMLMAVSWLEGQYGTGWKSRGVTGAGSYNMGAIQKGSGWTGETFGHLDTKPNDGKSGNTVYHAEFRKYPNAVAGWADLAAQVYKHRGRETVRQAAQAGDINEFSRYMYTTGYYQGFGPDAEARIRNHIRQMTDAMEKANEELGTITAPPEKPVSWQATGADMSAEQKRRFERIAQTGYNSTVLGDRYMTEQAAMINQTQKALKAMQDTPPLKLLVNPNQWSVAHEKILTDGERSRRGPIIQVWGAGQPKISASGKVPGFFSLSVPDANGPGLTRHARNYSAGWQNFQSLYAIYRNNGRIYLDDPLGGSGAKNLSLVGSVYIYYDNTLYIGSFDSLNVTESDTAPHTAEYQFEFSVRAMFLLDVPIDPGLQQGNLDYLRGGALPGDSTLGRGPTFG
jgi:hypothetical protein